MIETTIPKTSHGSEINAWAKVLTSPPALDAKNGWDFNGTFVQRGALVDVAEGSVLLECAGSNKHGGKRLFVLWLLDEEGEWTEMDSDDTPAWPKGIREEARSAMGVDD